MLFSTMPPITPPDWTQVLSTFGAALITGLTAWLVRGRKEARRPFNPAVNGPQPRMLTRDEVHRLIDIMNVWEDMGGRVRRNEVRLDGFEQSDRDKGERLVRLESQQEEAVRRMDARDKLAERERAEIMTTLNRIEEKVDSIPRRA